MNAKITLISFFSLITLLLAAGERSSLLNTFSKENAAAEKLMQKGETTVDLTMAAGNLLNVSESQYFRALDYKLRHTANLQERLAILKRSHAISLEVQKVYNTPREGQGSSIGMQIYHHIAILFQQQTAVLLLDNAAEKRWKRIADAPLLLNGKELELKQGKTRFPAVMHDYKITLESILFPKDTFRFQNRDFAVIRTDIPFAASDDYSTVYLCEYKKGKLQVHSKCKFPLITKWKLQGNLFLFYDGENVQKIKLN